ncbi:uncharacterized protein BCR38DRAFT_436712 [Pseudomassariella vexata]|uniref:Uncharacterized protein n=1 Tax=Pseudomassariella vexata TaxID=1141098 RepID=A0A1Y2DVS4_9PEZI|nr:uncharacterized protein BCR38DRAFT_436712 [Pseudomassariella vexata]ORY63390.1 hypothetical protein BCR38DRAFT_436712 [Pseudomassariella vexata]
MLFPPSLVQHTHPIQFVIRWFHLRVKASFLFSWALSLTLPGLYFCNLQQIRKSRNLTASTGSPPGPPYADYYQLYSVLPILCCWPHSRFNDHDACSMTNTIQLMP